MMMEGYSSHRARTDLVHKAVPDATIHAGIPTKPLARCSSFAVYLVELQHCFASHASQARVYDVVVLSVSLDVLLLLVCIDRLHDLVVLGKSSAYFYYIP